MKVLTATSNGSKPGDFSWTVEGEPVLLPEPCDRDRFAEEDGGTGCGCSRAFGGMSSMKVTTTAMVRDLPLTRDELFVALHSALQAAGLAEETLEAEDVVEIQEELDWLLELAADVEVGTVFERDFDEVRERQVDLP